MAGQGSFDSIEEIENVWIQLTDGTRIAARVWLPQGVRDNPVPAIFEYVPYRKRDLMRARDESIHRYFPTKGYASIRVDIRGSGDSEGVLEDEYTEQEQQDAVEIIDWISKQPWCSGQVGMMGISWGGFNALQVAAHNPPALKGIITLCSTDDRYADDVHYMGGCLLSENLQWGSIMTLFNALPPDPAIAGESWREMWRERLENLYPLAARWMEHQVRNDYWKQGSVCEDYSAIKCPVYAVGGWADGYSNAVPRLLAGLNVPKKGLVGPWTHCFPHSGVPGPEIGFLQEAVRWWDYCLKGIDNGIMDGPQYRVWLEDYVPPQPFYEEKPGRWVAEEQWPSDNVKPLKFMLTPGKLQRHGKKQVELSFSSPQSTGKMSGVWCGMGMPGETSQDQRADDGASLVFGTDPLKKRIEIFGAPEVELDIKVDKPVALIAARLNDVAPDGSSQRITYGLLNLTHRESHETPELLEPGQWYRVTVKMNDCAYAFTPGHTIRLSLSTSFWPHVWPSPEPVTMTVRTGTSALKLPVRLPQPLDKKLTSFGPPEKAPANRPRKLEPVEEKWRIRSDLIKDEIVVIREGDGGELGGATKALLEDIGTVVGYYRKEEYRIRDHDPLSCRARFIQTATLARDDWNIKVEMEAALKATKTDFRSSAILKTFDNRKPFVNKAWDIRIPRHMV